MKALRIAIGRRIIQMGLRIALGRRSKFGQIKFTTETNEGAR